VRTAAVTRPALGEARDRSSLRDAFRRLTQAPGRAWRREERSLVIVIALAWLIAGWLELSGEAGEVHHGRLASGHMPVLEGALLMLFVWQVMTAAMMLPATLPALRAFEAAAGGTRAAVRGAYLVAYFGVWTGFALVAFIVDTRVHALVDGWPWLDAHSVVIASATFALAAAYQCSGTKRAFVAACRRARKVRLQSSPGLRDGLEAGARYGLDCVGACWALMLVMFAAGAGELVWMAALALVIVGERSRRGARLSVGTSVAFALLAALAPVVPILAPPA